MKAEGQRAANRRRLCLRPSAFRLFLSARLLAAGLLALAMPLCGAGSANAAQKTGRQPGPVVMTPQAATTIQSYSVSSPAPSFTASDPDASPVTGSPTATVGWTTPQVLAAGRPPLRALAPGRAHLDLEEANRRQLIAAGLKPENIITGAPCTACRNDLLYSYRREGAAAGRLHAVITLR